MALESALFCIDRAFFLRIGHALLPIDELAQQRLGGVVFRIGICGPFFAFDPPLVGPHLGAPVVAGAQSGMGSATDHQPGHIGFAADADRHICLPTVPFAYQRFHGGTVYQRQKQRGF